MPIPTFFGPERTLSSDLGLPTASLQSITALANGSFVTTIATPGTNGIGYAFTHYGDGRWKSYTALNASGGTSESNWTASALKDGGFVLSWDNDIVGTPWEEYVHARIYNADGSIRVSSFQVNDVDTKSDRNGTITALANGNFAVLYTNEATGDGQNDLFVKMFAANGTPLADGVRVGTKVASDQEAPSAAGLKNGSLVIVYEDDSFSPDHPDSTTVRGAIITVDGQTIEFHVPQGLAGHQGDPQVAALANGQFAVTWTNWANLSDARIHARIYNADGTAASDITQVNTTDEWNQHESSVTALKNGGFAVAFTHNGLGVEDNGDILVQFFTASGEKDGDEIRVNTTTRGDQTKPVITELADGRLVVGWHDQALKDNPTNIRYQVLDARSGAIALSGTAGADDYVGSAYNDLLKGALGNDKLAGNGGYDSLYGDAGLDVLYGGTGNDRLYGGNDGDTLLGEAGVDTLYGDYGNDRLYGGTENDLLYGGAGNDQLKGDAGNDKLWGSTGNDVLYGGAGYDVFLFDASLNKANTDKVVDFSYRYDTVWIDNRIFSKLGAGTLTKPLKLNAAYFAYDKAKDANDFVIYNKATGKLSIDLDGSGARAAYDIAIFKAGTALYASDIYII